MQTIDVEERRRRLAIRHHLAGKARASTVVDVTRSLVALHSTDPASVYLSLRARTTGVTPAAIDDALYGEKVILRMLGMRRTMFVVPTELAPIVQSACTATIADKQRKLYAQLVTEAGVGDARFLAELGDETVAAVARRGEATGPSSRPTSPGCAHRSSSTRARRTAASRTSPPGSCSSSPPTGASSGAARAAPGPAASTTGHPSRPGCPVGWSRCRPSKPART